MSGIPEDPLYPEVSQASVLSLVSFIGNAEGCKVGRQFPDVAVQQFVLFGGQRFPGGHVFGQVVDPAGELRDVGTEDVDAVIGRRVASDDILGQRLAGGCAAGAAVQAGEHGGQLLYIDEIENYPGTEKTSGYALAESFEKQAVEFGVRIEYWEAKSIEKDGDIFRVKTSGEDVTAKAVIYAAGARHRHLGCSGEEEYQGKGVSYCATCDGPFFKGKKIAVVGGGDTALTDALYLSKLGSEVILIHRRNEFRGQKVLQDRIKERPNVRFELGKIVEAINGDGKNVKSLTLSDGSEIEADAVFIFVGIIPNSEILEGFAELDHGFVKTDGNMRTSVPGLFACGDVRTTPFRQVATAAGDGAIAAHSADEYIQSL